MSETPDDITELLRQAQDRVLDARSLLEGYSSALQRVADWHRIAGHAFAEEGLETDVLRQTTDARIECERRTLREKLRRILGS